MKKTCYLMMFVMLSLALNSCEEGVMSEPSIDLDEIEDQIFKDSANAQRVVCELYEVDEHGNYKLKYGRNIDPAEPNKYYYVCEGAQEAALFYNAYCSDNPLMVSYENVADSLVTKFDVVDRKSIFGDYGYANLVIANGNPDYARIELSFKSIGEVHELIFVPQSYMPDNSETGAFQSPYELGGIYQELDGEQWLCVRESQPGYDGYLVRLTLNDDNWWVKYLEDHYKKIWYACAQNGNQIADTDAWKSFCEMSKWKQGKYALEAMINNTNGVSMFETRELLKTLRGYNENWFCFQRGAVRAEPRKYHAACARHIYKIWFSYTVIHGRHGYYLGMGYAWHEFNDLNMKNVGYCWGGREMLQKSFRDKHLPNMEKLFPEDGPARPTPR